MTLLLASDSACPMNTIYMLTSCLDSEIIPPFINPTSLTESYAQPELYLSRNFQSHTSSISFPPVLIQHLWSLLPFPKPGVTKRRQSLTESHASHHAMTGVSDLTTMKSWLSWTGLETKRRLPADASDGAASESEALKTRRSGSSWFSALGFSINPRHNHPDAPGSTALPKSIQITIPISESSPVVLSEVDTSTLSDAIDTDLASLSTTGSCTDHSLAPLEWNEFTVWLEDDSSAHHRSPSTLACTIVRHFCLQSTSTGTICAGLTSLLPARSCFTPIHACMRTILLVKKDP